jgi:hypothetical protein
MRRPCAVTLDAVTAAAFALLVGLHFFVFVHLDNAWFDAPPEDLHLFSSAVCCFKTPESRVTLNSVLVFK